MSHTGEQEKTVTFPGDTAARKVHDQFKNFMYAEGAGAGLVSTEGCTVCVAGDEELTGNSEAESQADSMMCTEDGMRLRALSKIVCVFEPRTQGANAINQDNKKQRIQEQVQAKQRLLFSCERATGFCATSKSKPGISAGECCTASFWENPGTAKSHWLLSVSWLEEA